MHRQLLGKAIAVVLGALLVGSLLVLRAAPPDLRPAESAQPGLRAAIIDQVGLTHPNQKLIALASGMMKIAGYEVDIYTGPEVTVEFYKNLATHGYRLIVFRTHASDVSPKREVALFTSELYRADRWGLEQLRDYLGNGHMIADPDGPAYFVVTPAFVREEMRGRLDGALLIIGGCNSLSSPELAQAFMDRGGSGVVGWDDSVDLVHNDRAIVRLLLAMLGEGASLDEAVRRATIDVGPDPVSGGELTYLGQGAQVVPVQYRQSSP